jgi:hypothetical protein
VRSEIINGHFHRQTAFQTPQMINEQFAVNRIRVVKIRLFARIERHIAHIAVIRILLDQNHIARANCFDNLSRNRCFSRTCSAADTNYHFLKLS